MKFFSIRHLCIIFFSSLLYRHCLVQICNFVSQLAWIWENCLLKSYSGWALFLRGKSLFLWICYIILVCFKFLLPLITLIAKLVLLLMLFRNLLIIFSIHKVFFIFSKWIVTQIFLEFNPFFFLAFNSLSSLSAYRRFDSNFNTYCSSTKAFFSNIVVPQIRSVVGDLILGWWLILKLGSIQLYR